MKFIFQRIIFAIVFLVFLTGLIALARGYRLNFSQKSLQSTGILVASSSPDGAKIYIDGQLKGATNTNITVRPGVYNVKIEKDGFSAWEKQLTIKGELVIKADALLFPKNPSLSPVTSLGIVKAFASNSSEKIILLAQSGDIEKDGVYMLDNSRNPLSRVNPLKLLALKTSFPIDIDFANVTLEFSPDEQEILVSINDPKTNAPRAIYLLSSDTKSAQSFEVTQSVRTIRSAWQIEQAKLTQKILDTFDEPLTAIATSSFDIIAFSPDDEKILYRPKSNLNLPVIIEPRIIATNQTEETRDLKQKAIYVYDTKEDKNFELFGPGEKSGLVLWFPTSNHLVIQEADSIAIVDYDGTNKRTVYSGPFRKDFLTTSKDGKLFVLSNLNTQTDSLPDVYTVGIR